MGLNINIIKSNKVVSLASQGIEIAPVNATIYTVWIKYNGTQKVIKVYMTVQGQLRLKDPLFNESLNIGWYLNQHSYFGFAASTGNLNQLNCLLKWNLTVEKLPKENDKTSLKIGLGAGIPGLALLLVTAVGLYYFLHKRRPINDPRIMGTLKILPGTPREFRFKGLRRATNNFDEKMKLGQGGFGIVYEGVLAKENNMEIVVKKFARENIQGKDNFLAELTIINCLRHKHLVRLVGMKSGTSWGLEGEFKGEDGFGGLGLGEPKEMLNSVVVVEIEHVNLRILVVIVVIRVMKLKLGFVKMEEGEQKEKPKFGRPRSILPCKSTMEMIETIESAPCHKHILLATAEVQQNRSKKSRSCQYEQPNFLRYLAILLYQLQQPTGK
ncbi:hypothetical protein GIB67_006509 [Kingdonia uniflora]|uniref:Protein kinase domain-containing protein n=1 Tax=Kingdonia uniflora TaxID=39325 RepID=A0A7J7LEY2_9MAGN|nr:hypothetical protein GIB67_006509 [Kingdonia uniflora]